MKINSAHIISFLFSFLLLLACGEDTIEFGGTGKIKGKVVEDISFIPVENAKVELSPSGNTVFTDEEGNFEMENVTIGEYSVSATKEGFLTGYEPAKVEVGSEVNVVFELKIETANNRPPDEPKLISPEDNAQDVALTTNLVWGASDPDKDQLTFTLKIRNDKNNDEILKENITDTIFQLTELTTSTKYFWQVSAYDSINAPVWSKVRSFSTSDQVNSRYLYVKSTNGNNVIYSRDDDGTESALTSASLNSWRPRKNSSSNLIAFLRTDENFETQIYTINPDGSNLFKVTRTPVAGFKPSEMDFSWNSNGSKLIYPHFDKLYEINKDGSGLRLIHQTTDGNFISECDWSYDGSTIAVKTNNSNGYNVSIYTIDMNGNKKTNVLTGVNGAAGGLNLSVDGKILLYTYDISGFESSSYRQLNTRLFIYDFPSNTRKDISENKTDGSLDLDPRFSPDEAKVIFVNTSNDGVSQKNIFIQNIRDDGTVDGTQYNREELVSDAIMPDWE
ncbi:MAG: carboxypeptidase regulatory-like domain-containing protein [Lutimonas sp.]